MSVKSMLTQRCTIQRWSDRVPNSDAELVPSFTDVATDQRCLIQEHKTRVMSNDRGITVHFMVTGFFLPAADIRPQQSTASDEPDQVVLTTNGAGTYKVLGVSDEAGKGVLKTVALEGV